FAVAVVVTKSLLACVGDFESGFERRPKIIQFAGHLEQGGNSGGLHAGRYRLIVRGAFFVRQIAGFRDFDGEIGRLASAKFSSICDAWDLRGDRSSANNEQQS